MGKSNAEMWGHFSSYLLFMFFNLIEFSATVLACGYKSCLSISQDSPKDGFCYRCTRRVGRVQEEAKIYVCKEKHDPGSLLPVSKASFPLPWRFISTIFQPGVLEQIQDLHKNLNNSIALQCFSENVAIIICFQHHNRMWMLFIWLFQSCVS